MTAAAHPPHDSRPTARGAPQRESASPGSAGARPNRVDFVEATWLAAAALVPLAFNPWGANAFELPKVALLRAIVLAAGLAVLVRNRAALPEWRRMPAIGWVALTLGAAYVLATAFSIHPLTSLWGSYERQQGLLTLLAYLVLFSVTAAYLRTRAQMDRLWRALVLASVPVVAYALLQAARLDPFEWHTDAASPLTSTLGRANVLGSYLVLILPLTLARLLASRRWPYATLAAAQLACLALTLARGAWIGLIVGGVAVGAVWLITTRTQRRVTWPVTAALVLFVGTAWLAGPSMSGMPGLERMAQLARMGDGSTAARLTIWRAVLPLIGARPWFGYGPDTTQAVFTPVYPPQLVYYQGRGAAVDRAHNLSLDDLLSTGLAGTLALACLLAVVLRTLWPRLGTSYTQWERCLSFAMVGALAAHVADLQFAFDLTATSTVFWLMLAMGAALGSRLRETPADSDQAVGRHTLLLYLPAAVLVALLIGTTGVRPLLADSASRQSQDAARPIAERMSAAQQAVLLWPPEAEYYVRLAGLYAAAGRFADSETTLAEAGTRSPDEVRIWALRGDLYARWSEREPARLTSAEQAYRRATALAPNIAAYHAALGWTLVRQDRVAEGAVELERATALDATDAIAFSALADAYARLGRQADALRAQQEAARWSRP